MTQEQQDEIELGLDMVIDLALKTGSDDGKRVASILLSTTASMICGALPILCEATSNVSKLILSQLGGLKAQQN